MKKFTSTDLRILRQLRNMKQIDVAHKMQISPQRYSELTNNEFRPDSRTLEILTALNFTPEIARKVLDSILSLNEKMR